MHTIRFLLCLFVLVSLDFIVNTDSSKCHHSVTQDDTEEDVPAVWLLVAEVAGNRDLIER